jgi:glycosyltransferase involved in cell wall biosynthesis
LVILNGRENFQSLVESFPSDNSLIVIEQKYAGVSAARNAGVLAAKANYVAFLDPDDYWLPCHLEELNKLIKYFPNIGLFSTAHKIIENNIISKPAGPENKDFFGIISNIYDSFGQGFSIINSSTACVNVKFLNIVGGFPLGITCGEDVYIWLRLSESYGFAHSGAIGAIYDKDSYSTKDKERQFSIPYHFTYLDELIINNRNLSLRKLFFIKKLLYKLIIIQASSILLKKDFDSFNTLNNDKILKNRFIIRLILLILKYIPTNFFIYFRKLRRAF